MQDSCIEHVRFSVHTTNSEGSMVEMFNTGMMSMADFLGMQTLGHAAAAISSDQMEILLDFNETVGFIIPYEMDPVCVTCKMTIPFFPPFLQGNMLLTFNHSVQGAMGNAAEDQSARHSPHIVLSRIQVCCI
jgi:hypothetical protein